MTKTSNVLKTVQNGQVSTRSLFVLIEKVVYVPAQSPPLQGFGLQAKVPVS